MNNKTSISKDHYQVVFHEWVGVKQTDPNYSSITFSRERGLTIQEFVAIVRRFNKSVFPFLL